MKSIIEFSHNILIENIGYNSTVIDYTCGNGNDTLFLAKNFKNVIAFDIQEKAIENTKNLLQNNNINNVQVILDGHENIEKYVKNLDGGIFNLGYLPNSDKKIITKKETTIISIKNSLSIINKNGIIVIVCYIGHNGGLDEAIEIEEFCKKLSFREHNVLTYKFINKNLSPFVIAIKKQ